MTDDRDERELRDLFHALKREDERLAPSFDKICDGAFTRWQESSRSWRLVGGIAAAIALILFGGLTLVPMHSPRPLESTLRVSEWRSPTESLLKSLEDPLLKTVPRFDAPVGGVTPVMPGKKIGGGR